MHDAPLGIALLCRRLPASSIDASAQQAMCQWHLSASCPGAQIARKLTTRHNYPQHGLKGLCTATCSAVKK
jgi:hypothetical protein